MVAVIDPLGARTVFKYGEGAGSDFWAASKIIRPDGVIFSSSFDQGGAERRITDGSGRTAIYRYGPLDLLEQLEDPKGGVLTFAYDGQERLTQVENQQGLRWVFERDAAGRVIRETDFGGLVLDYAYDKADRVIETRHMDGSRLSYAYDKSGLLIREEVYGVDGSLTDTTQYNYDGRGLLQRAVNGAATVEFSRDKLGRVTRETVNGREVKSAYDCCGNRVRREIGGRLVESVYDPLGALKSLTLGGHAPLHFTRDALGRETRRETPAGFKLDQSYDGIGQLLKEVAGFSLASLGPGLEGAMKAQQLGIKPQAASQVERAYAWTKAFEPQAIADQRWGETSYLYDAKGQIEQASFGDGTAERFFYDAALNIHGFGEGKQPKQSTVRPYGAGSGYVPPVDKGKFEAWASAPGGRVSQAVGPHGERIHLHYDLRGRVLERRVERNGFRVQVWHYEWDAKDRLIACTPEQERWTYGYDAFGRRVFKINATLAKKAARASGMVLAGDELRCAYYEEENTGAFRTKDGKPPRIGTAYA